MCFFPHRSEVEVTAGMAYNQTDTAIGKMLRWPPSRPPLKHPPVQEFRTSLDHIREYNLSNTEEIFSFIKVYRDSINSFTVWMLDGLRDTPLTHLWRSLRVYCALVYAINSAGLRIYYSFFYARLRVRPKLLHVTDDAAKIVVFSFSLF